MKTNRILAMAVLVIASMSLQAQEKTIDITKAPIVEVRPEAKREVIPDELKLGIVIREDDYKAKHSLEQKQKDMIDVLKKLGINYKEDLFITQTGSNVRYKFLSRTMQPRSSASYLLVLHDAATMQRVLYELEKVEISNIQLVSIRYTKEDELRNELRMEAMKKAQLEARILAQGVGQEIGKALYINSWMNRPSERPSYTGAVVMDTKESSRSNSNYNFEDGPSINKLTYTMKVEVKFELK